MGTDDREKVVLVVDDDPGFRAAVATFLGRHGYRVIRADSGRAGLEAALLEEPDVVLLDVTMGERTEGFFTAQEFHRDERLADIPLFIVSASSSEMEDFGVAPDESWLRHDVLLCKPLDFQDLLARLREWTDGPPALARRSGKGGEP